MLYFVFILRRTLKPRQKTQSERVYATIMVGSPLVDRLDRKTAQSNRLLPLLANPKALHTALIYLLRTVKVLF